MRSIGRLTGPWRSRPVAPARRAPRRRRRRRPAAACLAREPTRCWAWALRVSRLSAVTCCYGLVARRTEHDESAIRLGALTEGWDAGAPHPSVLSCSEELAASAARRDRADQARHRVPAGRGVGRSACVTSAHIRRGDMAQIEPRWALRCWGTPAALRPHRRDVRQCPNR